MNKNIIHLRGLYYSAISISVILLIYINGDMSISRYGNIERWYGWPFIYYGDSGPGSVELQIYIIPLLVNFIIDIIIAALATILMLKILSHFEVPFINYSKIIYVFSIMSSVVFLPLFFGLSERTSLSYGPRDRMELSDRIILAPRFTTNPS